MKMILSLSTLLLLMACSSGHAPDVTTELSSSKDKFTLTDEQGDLPYERQILVEEKKHKLSTMVKISDPAKKDKSLLEKTISVSEMGSIHSKKNKRNVIRPTVSQHTVWLEGKKYFTQIKVNVANRELEVTMESPEEKWNGLKREKLPQSQGLYCFFSQIPECLRFSNILFELKKKPKSSMKLGIIWESYPYMSLQWENMPAEVVSFGRIFYDGISEDNEYKYNLEFNGQVAFFHFKKNFELSKFLWVAQGISIVK